jgi:hypothetical protein
MKKMFILMLCFSLFAPVVEAKSRKHHRRHHREKAIDMRKVKEEGDKKAEELKLQEVETKKRWGQLSDEDKKTLENKVMKMNSEEKKAFKEKLDTMSADDLKTFIQK